MYKIELSDYVLSALRKILKKDKKLYLRIISAIRSLSVNPFKGKKLRGKFQDRYSIRVGPYRVIYFVFKKKLIVYIISFGHRQGIYT